MENTIVDRFENRQTLGQIGRFIITGIINTALDFIILNILSKVTHIGAHDSRIIFLNVVSFSCATINSYFLNKYWSFHDNSTNNRPKQFAIFLLVSILGVLINTSVLKLSVTYAPGIIAWIANLITTVFPFAFLQKIDLTLNLAKVFATGVSLVWNFIGYKLIVFKK